MKLILADRCSYLPDFFIVKADGTPEFHETKGFWRDDARIKVKMAAKLFPCFVFTASSGTEKAAGVGSASRRRQRET